MSIRILPAKTSSVNTGLDFSRFYSTEKDNVFPHFSIKYVHSGAEFYKTENANYKVGAGEILIAPGQRGSICIDNKEETIGICICIDEKTVSDAFRLSMQCFFADPDEIFCGFDNQVPFFERKVNRTTANFGKRLYDLCEHLKKGDDKITGLNDEWFLTIANEIAIQEVPNIRSYYQLPFSKASTKKEILKRLLISKTYIDDEFLTIESIDEISKIALLSKFHFFRAFKLAFGITPYQYLLAKRLTHAKQLILTKNEPLSEIASAVKFRDQFSFSKSFKKRFGIPPSLFKTGN